MSRGSTRGKEEPCCYELLVASLTPARTPRALSSLQLIVFYCFRGSCSTQPRTCRSSTSVLFPLLFSWKEKRKRRRRADRCVCVRVFLHPFLCTFLAHNRPWGCSFDRKEVKQGAPHPHLTHTHKNTHAKRENKNVAQANRRCSISLKGVVRAASLPLTFVLLPLIARRGVGERKGREQKTEDPKQRQVEPSRGSFLFSLCVCVCVGASSNRIHYRYLLPLTFLCSHNLGRRSSSAFVYGFWRFLFALLQPRQYHTRIEIQRTHEATETKACHSASRSLLFASLASLAPLLAPFFSSLDFCWAVGTLLSSFTVLIPQVYVAPGRKRRDTPAQAQQTAAITEACLRKAGVP